MSDFVAELGFARKLVNSFLERNDVKVVYSVESLASVNVKDKRINIDFSKVFDGQPDEDAMMELKGLLFHEGEHIHRPLPDSPNVRHLREIGNILEDGRIETRSALQYSKLADYFAFCVNKHLISQCNIPLKKQQVLKLYALLYGRKLFVDPEIVAELRKKLIIAGFIEKHMDDVENIIDAYTFTDTKKGRWDLIIRLHAYLDDDSIGYQNMIFSSESNTGTYEEDLTKDRKDEAKKASESISQSIKEKGKPTPQEVAEANQKRMEDQKQIDRMREAIDKMRDKRVQSSDSNEVDKLSEWIDDMVQELAVLVHEQDTQVLDGIDKRLRETNKALVERNQTDLDRDLEQIGRKLPEINGGFTPSMQMYDIQRKLTSKMKKLRLSLKSGYVNNQKSGRLNVRSYVNKQKGDMTIFKKFKPSKVKDNRMMVNLYLDKSASMGNFCGNGMRRYDVASQCAWILTESIEKSGDDAVVRVITFEDETRIAKEYKEKLQIPSVVQSLSTQGSDAIKKTNPSAETYRKKHGYHNVMDIFITDGHWHGGGTSQIAMLNKQGHETVMVSIVKDYGSKGAKHYKVIEDVSDLPDFLYDVIAKYKRSVVRKVRV